MIIPILTDNRQQNVSFARGTISDKVTRNTEDLARELFRTGIFNDAPITKKELKKARLIRKRIDEIIKKGELDSLLERMPGKDVIEISESNKFLKIKQLVDITNTEQYKGFHLAPDNDFSRYYGTSNELSLSNNFDLSKNTIKDFVERGIEFLNNHLIK